MKDIYGLSLSELFELNQQVVARIKELSLKKQAEILNQFRSGDNVSFLSERKQVRATVVKVHKRSVTVKTSSGEWLVPPTMLQKISLPGDKIPIWKKIFRK